MQAAIQDIPIVREWELIKNYLKDNPAILQHRLEERLKQREDER